MTLQRFLVIGAGGTASYLVPGLIRWLNATLPDKYELLIVDGDAVEQGNLARQAHTQTAVGLNKAEALLQAHTTPGQKQVAIPHYLSDANCTLLITEGSTVLITVDNMPCRARIEAHAKTLKNVRVFNAGNEEHTGSVQIWLRDKNKNITPPIGFMHAEISAPGPDRAALTCAQVAALPGGGQTTLANMLSATYLLQALNRAHQDKPLDWHELQFDALSNQAEFIDWRNTRAWKEMQG